MKTADEEGGVKMRQRREIMIEKTEKKWSGIRKRAIQLDEW